jgi:hypothetical protein
VTTVAPAKFIGSTFGLAGFAIAIVAGLGAHNPPDRILGRALICLIVCQVVGWVIGWIGEHAIREGLRDGIGIARADGAPDGSARTAPSSAGEESEVLAA